jgi:hypothetical protein
VIVLNELDFNTDSLRGTSTIGLLKPAALIIVAEGL